LLYNKLATVLCVKYDKLFNDYLDQSRIHPQEYSAVSAGDTYTVKCLVDDLIEWSYNMGEQLPKNFHIFPGGVAQITKVQDYNGGRYTCKGYSKSGQRNHIFIASFTLIVLSKLLCKF